MDSAQQSPVLPACCFAPAAWKGVLSSKRANQVAPAEMVALESESGASLPSQGAGKAFQSAENHGLERVETPPTRVGVHTKQIVGREGVLAGKGGPCRLTVEIRERGDGLSPERPHSGLSSSPSSTECEPIPAGTPLWNALLHQSPSREPIRTSHAEKLDTTAGYVGGGEPGESPLKQLSTVGRASVVVTSVPSKLSISVPLDQHAAAVHICTASESKSGGPSAGVMSWGGVASCLQCSASAGALDAMRKYWEQAEQRAREAEVAATRMGRNEERLMAQLALLLKQIELRQVQVEHLSGLVAQQQAAFLALDGRYLERLRREQGLPEEPATSPSPEAVRGGQFKQPVGREVSQEGIFSEGQLQVEHYTSKEQGKAIGRETKEELATGQSSHQHDVSEGAGGEAKVKRLHRGASLDAWAEPRDVSDMDGDAGPCCGDSESGADSSFEFDTSPLAVLSASSPEAESEGGSPGIRRKRRGQRKEVEVIVEEMVDACAGLESAQGGFGEFFVSPNVPESPLKRRIRDGDKRSCDSPVESERDSGSPPGEGVGAGRKPGPEGSTEARSSEREVTEQSGFGGSEDAVLKSGEGDGFDQQESAVEGDAGAVEEQCVEVLQGEVGVPEFLRVKQDKLSSSEAEGRSNGSTMGVGSARVAFVLGDGVGQQKAWGGGEAKREEKESGSEEMEEFLGLATEEKHMGYGVEEQLQGSAPPELTEVGSLNNLGQGTGREVTVEGAEASFQLGYAELARASSYDEKALRSSWPVTAAGAPQIRTMNGRWVEGEGAENIPSDGRIPEQNGRAYTVDGRSGSGAWGMVPLEIAQEVVVEGFGEEDFDGWRHGSVSESRSASRTSADTFSPEPPLMESSGGASRTDGFAERSSPQGRQGAWRGSPKLVPCSPQGPRSKPPSPRVVSPKTGVPTPPVNPRGPSPSSPHFASAHEVSRKMVGTVASGRRVGSQGDFGAAAHRLDTRAGRLFRRDSLPRRNNTSDPFGLQEAALVPHPPAVAAPARKPSTREKHLAASVGGRQSSDKENDLPKVPTVTLRLEGLGFNRKTGGDFENGRRVGSDLMQTSGLELGTEWGSSASDVHSSDVAAPEPPAKPRTTSSRPQFRALRPMAS
ncbi:hypothetical protein KFL_002970120 [Klebsormidium nitens]|uniref:Uncharacterized protein n=1 Tax=Klebsormidium nitens TaxID=105231 RepID=A0A1Y1I6I8_KLENI|nr:hypothetical protein KFL_002970120 [Klebsormidium nitens]|eukprot:GAQ86574.1 hypothetical protein KFL_002970120 [Klebsormidium nitens]